MSTTVPNRELIGEDISVHLSPQTTKGIVDSNPEFFKVKRVGGMPKQSKASTTSSTLSNSQNGKQNIQTSSEQGAEISTEVFQQTKDLITAAIHSDIDDNTVIASDIEITATGFEVPGNNFAAGDFIFVSGATDDDNNITYYVDGVVGDVVETTPAPASVEVAGDEITVSSNRYKNGLSPTYFLGQRRQLDKSRTGELAYFNFTDGLINTLSLEIPEEELLTATTNIMWEVAAEGRTPITGQTDSADDESSAVGVENQFKKFWVDGAPADCSLKSASIEIANNYEGSAAAGCKRKSLGARSFAVTGSFVAKNFINNSTYWEDKFLNAERVKLSFEIVWEDGKAMVVQVEKAYPSEHEQSSEAGFSNSSISFNAEENTDNNSTIQVFTNF